MKTPKRVKGYTSSDLIHERRNEVAAWNDDERVVRVVELRKGEVIVDVEALVEAYWGEYSNGPLSEPLRAALRKVGKR